MRWTEVFGRSSAARAAFTVRPDFADVIRQFTNDLPLPEAHNAGMYSPIVDGWAFLDGGIHHIDSHGYGMTTLHTGLRVIGWQSMRLLCEAFGFTPPVRRLAGEPCIEEPAELTRRLRAVRPDDADGLAHAELIVSITDGATLRDVCRRLIGDHALNPKELAG